MIRQVCYALCVLAFLVLGPFTVFRMGELDGAIGTIEGLLGLIIILLGVIACALLDLSLVLRRQFQASAPPAALPLERPRAPQRRREPVPFDPVPVDFQIVR